MEDEDEEVKARAGRIDIILSTNTLQSCSCLRAVGLAPTAVASHSGYAVAHAPTDDAADARCADDSLTTWTNPAATRSISSDGCCNGSVAWDVEEEAESGV